MSIFGVVAAFGFLKAGSLAAAENNASAKTPDPTAATATTKESSDLRVGPFDLHPRVTAGLTYDDNIYFTKKQVADTIWKFQPGLQAVAGDDAALIANRDQNGDVLNLSPGSLIIQSPEFWPGKLLILDYSPRFKFYTQHTVNNAIDQFATVNLLWPMNKLILGFKQEYQVESATLIQVGRFATTETIPTTLSAAYQFGEKTSLDSNFRRLSLGYDQSGLIGYTEYSTEDWFNYEVTQSMPVSVGLLAGYDEVDARRQNQTYEQLRTRVRYYLTEKFTFDASFGGELRQFENGNASTLIPVFSLAGTYRPADRTTVSLSGTRQQSASIFNGYNYTSTGVTLALSQGITDRFTANASVGYNILDYAPITRTLLKYTDEYYTARISLEAKILRHLTGQIFYQWSSRQSQISADINDNQIGVNLTLNY